MKILRIFISIILLFTIDHAAAGTGWVNNITINEYNITWNYTETYTAIDAISFRISIDRELGNNDSFVNAWELLKADIETRKRFRNSLENELDIRINNETSGIQLSDIESSLSQYIIGKTFIPDTIENRYAVTYRLNESIFNASSIWFLGEQRSPVTIITPPGIDVLAISGMDNETRIRDSKITIEGYFSNSSSQRGEITINITGNASFAVNHTNITTEVSSPQKNDNITKPASVISGKIRQWSIIGIGIVFIVLIYIFKVRKN